MISLDDARSYVFSLVRTLSPVEMSVADARGCVAAVAVIAVEQVPGFVNSSMDGFALRSADTRSGHATLRVVDSVRAGAVSSVALGPGEAARIMTGAPLPEGADCVEMIERVVVDEGASTVRIDRSIEDGMFVRYPGDDVRVGDVLIDVGDVLSATRIGVLASQGISRLLVHPRPRVGVVSTGNELARSGAPLGPGEIRDVNGPLLMALLDEAGVEAVDLGVVVDEYELTKSALVSAADTCDAIITTGGVSAGDVDYVKQVIGELGGDSARSLQVAVRPGKPFAVGVIGERRVPVFGLPGNPVSTRVSFETLVRPSLSRLAGRATTERLRVEAVADFDLTRTRDGRAHLMHVIAAFGDDQRVHVIRAMREGSHLLHAVSGANAIAIVPDGEGRRAGESVALIVLDPESLTRPAGPGGT